MDKVIHATNLAGIENLFNYESNGQNYICASSLNCSDYMHRDVLFMLLGEILESFSGDCGSDGHGNNIGSRDTEYDEIHLANDYEIEGLYWDDRKSIDLYGAAYAYIIYVLEKRCDIINADKEIEKAIKDWADQYENDRELFEELENLGIENLIV